MGKRYIDCSLNIVDADSWVQFPRKLVLGAPEPRVRVEQVHTTVNGRRMYPCCRLELTTQCFTHIDAPVHFYVESGRKIDEVPLDQFINDGVVIDMMHKQPGEGVTGEDLEKSGADVHRGDTIIIRTGWTDRAFGTREFWENMVHLENSAGDWILSKQPKALMQDFMTDIAPVKTCEHCGQLVPVPEFSPNHYKFLGNDMILIEWCTNLGAITRPRVQVIALPLKIKGGEGGPARVVVVEEDQ